jgi:nicotinamide-nucleotide amidase
VINAEIICTGSELLVNPRIDTNSIYLSREMEKFGILTRFKTIVGDQREDLLLTLNCALARTDVVILSGGLGPTVDDLTRDIIAEVTENLLVFQESVWDVINNRIQKIFPGRVVPENVKLQAFVPENADYFINQNGTAPGLALKYKHKIIIALPGPPKELMPMWQNQVEPWLTQALNITSIIKTRMIKTYGLPESLLNDRIEDLFKNSTNPIIGVCASPSMVDIRLTAWGDDDVEVSDKMESLEQELTKRLGEYIYGYGEDTLEKAVGDLLKAKHWKLSLAESCTGGMISHRITNIPGNSDYFDRGIITYSNQAKMEMLKVPQETLITHGAVSSQTAEAMAIGIQKLSGTEVALSVTGIAGPGGGTPEKPVGLVYIGLAKHDGTMETKEYRFSGDRELIKLRTSNEALDILRRYLLKT